MREDETRGTGELEERLHILFQALSLTLGFVGRFRMAVKVGGSHACKMASPNELPAG